MKTYQWPYPNEVGQEEVAECDVLVLGGGLAGCFAAIAAARKASRSFSWRRELRREAGLQVPEWITGSQPARTLVLR